MQYQPGTEKVAMTGGFYTTVVQPVSLADDPQIKRVRSTLTILISVCLGLCIISAISTISELAIDKSSGQNQKSVQVAHSVLSILFYGLGLLTAYKYYQTGLRVFAWMGIVNLVYLGIMIAISLVVIIGVIFLASTSMDNSGAAVGMAVGVAILVMIVFIAVFAVTVIIVNLAFKLARLIDANEHLATQQV